MSPPFLLDLLSSSDVCLPNSCSRCLRKSVSFVPDSGKDDGDSGCCPGEMTSAISAATVGAGVPKSTAAITATGGEYPGEGTPPTAAPTAAKAAVPLAAGGAGRAEGFGEELAEPQGGGPVRTVLQGEKQQQPQQQRRHDANARRVPIPRKLALLHNSVGQQRRGGEEGKLEYEDGEGEMEKKGKSGEDDIKGTSQLVVDERMLQEMDQVMTNGKGQGASHWLSPIERRR